MPTVNAPHDCQPPREQRAVTDDKWTCPECGAKWRARLTSPSYPAPMFDFEANQGVGWAEWVREDDPSD